MRVRHLILVVAVLLAVLLILASRLSGPSPKSGGDFSAVRARAVLEDVLGEQRPHPVGSPANQIVRDRIVSRFRALGYDTAIQRQFVCNARPTCATVENIVAGRFDIPPVLLVAHYDSVAAGPGTSDDGMGVAVLLEIASAVKEQKFRHPISFLITDGEEAGLLGAEAFVAEPKNVHAVINVENRGTSGPSFLFETSRGNGELIAAASAIRRPFASSLFYTVYELLPNDTDATVFKRAGMRVLNFAAIGGVAYYHTPLDDLRHADNRTLQHHGDNALAAARALAGRDLGNSPNAVYFDVLGFTIVRWPQPWTLPIAGVSLLVLLVLARGTRLRDVVLGFALWIGAVVVAAISGIVLTLLATVMSGDAKWVAYPQMAMASMWLAGAAASLTLRWLLRSADPRSLFAGMGVAWHVAAIAAAVFLPGVSHLFLVPAIAHAICAKANDLTRSLVPAVAAAIVLFPLGAVLYTALGKTSLVPIAVLIALVGTALPLTNGRVAAGALAIAASCAVGAMLLPTYSPANPRSYPIRNRVRSSIDVSGVREGARLMVTLRSRRKADQVSLDLPPGTRVLRVNGVTPAPQNPRRAYRHDSVAVYGSEATIELEARAPIEVTAHDTVYAPQKRDTPDVVTSGRGDVTVSSRKTRL